MTTSGVPDRSGQAPAELEARLADLPQGYVLADHPTGAWTLKLLIVAALLLLVVELLARRPPARDSATDAGVRSSDRPGQTEAENLGPPVRG